jgi:hypothetical protein
VKSRSAVTLVVLAVLGGGGTALAASGVSSVVFGDGDGATARSSQEPLERLSASPLAPDPNGEVVKGDETGDGIALGSEAQRQVAQGGAGGAGGGGGGRLPFTGLVAIPVIALGLALLGGGLALRRRTARALA